MTMNTNERGVEKASDLASLSSLGDEFAPERDGNWNSPLCAQSVPQKPAVLRVLLAEDHVLVRAGIRSLLQSLDGVEVVAEASNGVAALAFLEGNTPPDVAILDVSMQGMSGLELASRIKSRHPSVRVIMLSMHASREYVDQALQNGAAGYLLKDSGDDELEIALRAVSRGETYLSPAITQTATSFVNTPKRATDDVDVSMLTPRQREILILIAQGLPTGQIAARLAISVKTVETHRAQLMERLGIFEIAGLVRYAIRNRLIGAD